MAALFLSADSRLLPVSSHGRWGALLSSSSSSSFFKIILFTYLFIFGCAAQAFSSCAERGLLFVVVLGLLITVTSPVAKRRL